MKKLLIIILIVLSSQVRGQYQGLTNLDEKYGFNKFKLEEPFSKYKNSCKFLYGDNDNVKKYEYVGASINGVFGYFKVKDLYLHFYKDKLKEIEISKCHIYIFTSPSNLDAFLTINEIREDSKVIVWGNSTSENAKSKGLKVDFVLTKSSLDELIQFLSQIS